MAHQSNITRYSSSRQKVSRVNKHSKYRGVYKHNNVWQVHLRFMGKTYAECYTTEDVAAYAYNKLAIKYYTDPILNTIDVAPDELDIRYRRERRIRKYVNTIFAYTENIRITKKTNIGKKNVYIIFFNNIHVLSVHSKLACMKVAKQIKTAYETDGDNFDIASYKKKSTRNGITWRKPIGRSKVGHWSLYLKNSIGKFVYYGIYKTYDEANSVRLKCDGLLERAPHKKKI